MLRVRVSTASAEIIETELITAGRRGLECGFEFNSAWDGLAKTVIVNGVVKRDIVLVSDTITVPGECLVREQFPLRIGVYGANGAGEIVIPTIWANFGKILPSARPSGVDPDEVTPDVVAQIQTNSSNALQLAQEVMRRADSGEFDGRDGATGPSGADGRDGRNGNSIWTTTQTPMPASGGVAFTQLTGRSGVAPAVGDIVIRASRYVYQLVEISEGGTVFVARLLGDIKGEHGVADAIWRTTASIGTLYPSGYAVNVSDLVGRSGATPKAGDLVIGPDPGETGDPTHLYTIDRLSSSTARLDDVGSIRGATGATGPTGPQGPGVTEDLRAALLQLAQKVAYVDEHGADYYQDLYDALYPPAGLLSITATFTQGSTIIYDDADLDDLRPMLDVVGHYDDNTDAEVTNYDLSGSLTAGSSVVTVSYQSKTTTFAVNVTARPTLSSISAAYTQSGTVYDTNTLDSLKADLVVTAVYSDSSTQTVPDADYTLSGTLTVGTSTITVSYSGKTTTFDVVVTQNVPEYVTSGLVHKWDAIDNTASGHDSSATVWKDLVGSCDLTLDYPSAVTWESNAISFNPTTSTTLQTLSNASGITNSTNMTIEMVARPIGSNANESWTNSKPAMVASFIDYSSNYSRRFGLSAGDVSVGVMSKAQFYSTGLNSLLDIRSIVGTYTSTSAPSGCYVNGVALSSRVSHSYNGNVSGVLVGGFKSGSNYYPYLGKIYAIRIYNRVLTAEEIAQNYNADVVRFGLGG